MHVTLCYIVLQAYIEDAFGDCVWSGLDQCRKLSDNILTLFNTVSANGRGKGGGATTSSASASEAPGDDSNMGVAYVCVFVSVCMIC